MAALLRKLRALAVDLWRTVVTQDGPWNYAGCCGCGENVVNAVLVDSDNGRLVPGEGWCWSCWSRPCVGMPWQQLAELDHIELPRPLVMVPWREADRIVSALIAEREATR